MLNDMERQRPLESCKILHSLIDDDGKHTTYEVVKLLIEDYAKEKEKNEMITWGAQNGIKIVLDTVANMTESSISKSIQSLDHEEQLTEEEILREWDDGDSENKIMTSENVVNYIEK